ncbi:hypothetical protein ACLK2I_08235 [Escherichia coli]
MIKSRQAFMLVSNNLSWFIYKLMNLLNCAAVIDRCMSSINSPPTAPYE